MGFLNIYTKQIKIKERRIQFWSLKTKSIQRTSIQNANVMWTKYEANVCNTLVIHIQITLPHLKYRLCLLSFLSSLAMEWVGPSTRTYAGLIIAFFGPVGELYLELIAYLTRDWFWIVIGVAVPFVLVFILYWYGSWIIHHLVKDWSFIAIFRLYLSS